MIHPSLLLTICNLHINRRIRSLVNALNLLLEIITCVFPSEFEGGGEDDALLEFFGDEFEVVFYFFEAVEIIILCQYSQISFDFFDNFGVLDSIFMTLICRVAVLEAEGFGFFGVGVDDCYDMIPQRITMNEYCLDQSTLLISSLQFLWHNIFSL